MAKRILTLCLVYRDPQLLLGMKKSGFGAGRWNGFGGKLNESESIEEAAKREVSEESGISVLDIEKRAIIKFTFEKMTYDGSPEVEMHLFAVNDFSGEPKETDEMKPKWFHKNELPYDKMWPDDQYWMPLFLSGKKFRAHFHFFDNDKLLSHNIKEVEELKHEQV